MKWRWPPDLPKPKQTIVAELIGCKIGKFFRLTVREGEGLGHIKKWIPFEEFEERVEEIELMQKPERSQMLLAPYPKPLEIQSSIPYLEITLEYYKRKVVTVEKEISDRKTKIRNKE